MTKSNHPVVNGKHYKKSSFLLRNTPSLVLLCFLIFGTIGLMDPACKSSTSPTPGPDTVVVAEGLYDPVIRQQRDDLFKVLEFVDQEQADSIATAWGWYR